MPIIFATAVISLPTSLAQFAGGDSGFGQILVQFANAVTPLRGEINWGAIAFQSLLILFFSYFYASLIMNPVDMSQNLKKMGTFYSRNSTRKGY